MTTNNYSTAGVEEKAPKDLAEIINSFLKGLRKLWFVALIATICFGFLGYVQYKKNYVPVYESKATFSITAPEYGSEDRSYTNNSQLASILSLSFNYLINNEVFYEIIKEDLNIDYIPSVITISAVESTNILSITVSGADPKMNLKVLQSVMNNYGGVAEFVIGDTELSVLEEPTLSDVPTNPYAPFGNIMKFAMVGLLVGILPSIVYAFLIRTIRNKEDVEKQLSVTFLGSLPGVMLSGKHKKLENCSILDKEVGFRYLEAMRSVNSKCEKELEKNNYKVILVTSTLDGEGKSTVAMNLAYSLSKSQKRVMLVDGNIRKPALRKMIHPDMPDYKMEDFLNKKIKSSQAIVNLEGTRVLLLAPNIPSKNSVECLNSKAMNDIIEEGKEVVDYIIIDSPQCDISDTAVLAKYSDGVIYVVKEDYVRVDKIIDTLQEFSYTRTPIIGCILNSTEGKLNLAYGYGKHYGYGYHKGYGSKYYGRYGYGKKGYGYGYGGYGGYGAYGAYGTYGEVSEKEFRNKGRSVSKRISLETTEEQKRALEEEKRLELQELEEKEKAEQQNAEKEKPVRNKESKAKTAKKSK